MFIKDILFRSIKLIVIFILSQLKDLGFSEQQAAEAYFACEKNETLAANFLLNDFNDDE